MVFFTRSITNDPQTLFDLHSYWHPTAVFCAVAVFPHIPVSDCPSHSMSYPITLQCSRQLRLATFPAIVVCLEISSGPPFSLISVSPPPVTRVTTLFSMMGL